MHYQNGATSGGDDRNTTGCPFHSHASQPTYFSDVIASGKLTLAEVFTNFSEIMFAAADTTSNALCFILYLLATNPEVQARLREEVDEVVQNNGLNVNPVGKMNYLDSVIKETLRLYPLATMQCRILEEDIALAGYLVPKGTMFVMNHFAASRNPEVFEDPEEFRPERWIRDERNRMHHHPFAVMPFGYGKRTCLGKRFARMELHMAVAKIIHKFQVKPIESMPFDPVVRTILTPGDQVPVRFVDR
ncbi:hypothetical protein LSH36_69g04003 [Paralvinella palmiformis]|uniref:Cholesterol side-chain cleavage enzyme, mitochondrial n=1 Tax=Paralvinella palmiformis TaxID=53620 RepID=A0AAD9K387_9ANNE|nr:hypothetical protein LSH36_69g04003 [Paralvinella palmiformis]